MRWTAPLSPALTKAPRRRDSSRAAEIATAKPPTAAVPVDSKTRRLPVNRTPRGDNFDDARRLVDLVVEMAGRPLHQDAMNRPAPRLHADWEQLGSFRDQGDRVQELSHEQVG